MFLTFGRMNLHHEETNTTTATIELPGLGKEDVLIEVLHDRLTVSGETLPAPWFSTSTPRELVKNSKGARADEGTMDRSMSETGWYHIRERNWGRLSRTVQLPRGVKAEEVKATMEDGVLTVTFPQSAYEERHTVAVA